MTALRRVTATVVILLAAGQLAEISRGIYPSHANQIGWVVAAAFGAIISIADSFGKRNK